MTAGLPTYGAYPAAEQSPWPGPGPAGHPTWRPPQQPASKTMAGWALGLAFLPCLISMITSVVFAIIVLNRGKDGREHGKGMAIAALCLVGLWVVVGIGAVAISLASDAERGSDGAIEEAGEITAFELEVGDCFDLPTEDLSKETRVFTVDALPCDEQHQAEVYAKFELADGDAKRKGNAAQVDCANRFDDFIGIRPGQSKLDIYYMYEQGSGETVVCSVVQRSQKPVTGSLRGSKQ